MQFHSFQFLAFFIAVVCAHFLLKPRFRWVLLLAASYYFYMCWKAEYIVLIIVSTLIDYFCALALHRAQIAWKRKALLITSLSANLGILFFFKYANFFSESFNTLMGRFQIGHNLPLMHYLLPVGISFYTFQTLSYTIDVYRKEREPERHLGHFALYVAFFPQLVAGPIERSVRLLPQFRKVHVVDYERMKSGAQLMLWGFFKKIAVADAVGAYVNHVYGGGGSGAGITYLIATYFFAFQIYCDFSGYTDIAIGASKVLGYDLMKNFDRPYLAQSIRDFWRRWHISLSTWFRDYLYIPLGGNRVSPLRHSINLWIVFLLCGLWHGANWTFVVWGGLHGLYLMCNNRIETARVRLMQLLRLNPVGFISRLLGAVFTFHLVCLSWIFFRANSLHQALWICRKILFDFDLKADICAGRDPATFWISVAMVSLLLATEFAQSRLGSIRAWLQQQPTYVRWAFAYVGIFMILFFGGERVEFIYFQF